MTSLSSSLPRRKGASNGAEGAVEHTHVLPVAVLRYGAMQHNVATMARWCAEHNVDLAPHGKTTMCDYVVGQQLELGAWGMTAASVVQAVDLAAMGARRIIIANQVVDRASVAILVDLTEEDPELWVCPWVDSVAGVALLADQATRARRPIPVMIEVGAEGGRAGCRTPEYAREVAQAVSAASNLNLVGVGGFEGILGSDRSPETLSAVAGYASTLVDVLNVVEPWIVSDSAIVSVGGSAYFDTALEAIRAALAGGKASRKIEVVLRSGCYVTHDHGIYDRISPFGVQARSEGSPYQLRPALEVWGAVLSQPEPGLVIVGIGRRDISFEAGMPSPLLLRRRSGDRLDASGLRVTALNDQHAYIHIEPGAPVPAVGDVLSFGISHPCTTFDKWRDLVLLDDCERRMGRAITSF